MREKYCRAEGTSLQPNTVIVNKGFYASAWDKNVPGDPMLYFFAWT